MLVRLIKTMFDYGALVFAFGFIAPLVSQLIRSSGWIPPLGIEPLWIGLGVAGVYGTFAQLTGRWI